LVENFKRDFLRSLFSKLTGPFTTTVSYKASVTLYT